MTCIITAADKKLIYMAADRADSSESYRDVAPTPKIIDLSLKNNTLQLLMGASGDSDLCSFMREYVQTVDFSNMIEQFYINTRSLFFNLANHYTELVCDPLNRYLAGYHKKGRSVTLILVNQRAQAAVINADSTSKGFTCYVQEMPLPCAIGSGDVYALGTFKGLRHRDANIPDCLELAVEFTGKTIPSCDSYCDILHIKREI